MIFTLLLRGEEEVAGLDVAVDDSLLVGVLQTPAIWMPRRATSRAVSFPRLCRIVWSGEPSSSSMVM